MIDEDKAKEDARDIAIERGIARGEICSLCCAELEIADHDEPSCPDCFPEHFEERKDEEE